jgi:starvation-inducible outer membrane lipoprotein
MKKLLIVLATLMITGCVTVPPEYPKFPAVPDEIKTVCPALREIEPTTKLSDVVKSVVDNYGTYHECRIQIEGWIEWYNTQKEIYDRFVEKATK